MTGKLKVTLTIVDKVQIKDLSLILSLINLKEPGLSSREVNLLSLVRMELVELVHLLFRADF